MAGDEVSDVNYVNMASNPQMEMEQQQIHKPSSVIEMDDLSSKHVNQQIKQESTDDSVTSGTIVNETGSNLPGATMNFVNSIVGAGIIGLPHALYHSGFILGLLLLTLVSFFVDYGVKHMVLCGVRVRKKNFEDVMEYAFGIKGFYAVSIFMSIFAFGAMCAYHTVIGDTIPPIFDALFPNSILNNRKLIILIYSAILMYPLSLLKSMSSLAWTSSLSIISVLLIVIIVVIEAPINNSPDIVYRKGYTFAEDTWPAGVGAMGFAFVCHHSSFIVYDSLKNNTTKRWSIVTHSSLIISLSLCIVLAVSGYLNFQTSTKGDILNNFDYNNTPINVARAFLALTMVFTYPMENFVVRHCIMQMFRKNGYISNEHYNKYHYILTTILWIIALSIGLVVEDLGIVFEIIGIVGGCAIGFIFPGLVILRVKGFHNLKNDIQRKTNFKEKCDAISALIMPMVIILFGILIFIMGFISMIVYE